MPATISQALVTSLGAGDPRFLTEDEFIGWLKVRHTVEGDVWLIETLSAFSKALLKSEDTDDVDVIETLEKEIVKTKLVLTAAHAAEAPARRDDRREREHRRMGRRGRGRRRRRRGRGRGRRRRRG